MREAQRLASELERTDLSVPQRDLVVVAQQAAAELRRLDGLLWSPSIEHFLESVRLEAAHQSERWGEEHDAEKEPEQWYWLLGYLAGKALHAQRAGDAEKALHHTISSAAALSHWHEYIKGEKDD